MLILTENMQNMQNETKKNRNSVLYNNPLRIFGNAKKKLFSESLKICKFKNKYALFYRKHAKYAK